MADHDSADRHGGKRSDPATRNADSPDPGPQGGGPLTPGRAGQGMGVSAGDAGEVPPRATGGGPETTVTVGEDTGQRRDLPDQDGVPPTPKDQAGKRPRNAEEGKPG